MRMRFLTDMVEKKYPKSHKIFYLSHKLIYFNVIKFYRYEHKASFTFNSSDE